MKNIKTLPKESGIYLVTNMINNHKYVGQSKNIYVRFNSHHIYDYKNEKNSCYDTKFYRALRKYGIENFTVTVLELCDEKDLNEKEIYYIKLYNSYLEGYNSTPGGQSLSSKMLSEETEEKRRRTRELNQSLQSEKHPRSKMTNEEVFNVRQRYIDGESVKQIYQDYKDRYSNMHVFERIIMGDTYTSVGNIPTKSQIRHTNGKLTEKQVKEIRTRYKNGGVSYAQLGREYGLSSSSVAAIVRKETYKHVTD